MIESQTPLGCIQVPTYIFPPNSLELIVTIAAPIHTSTNTSANSGPPSLVLSARSVEPWSMVAMSVQSNNGPHRSPEKICSTVNIKTFNKSQNIL